MSMSRIYVNGFVCVFVIFCFDPYTNDLAVFLFPFLFVTVSACVSCCVFFSSAGLATVYRGRSAFLDGHREVGQ